MVSERDLRRLVDRFSKVRVLVAGDIILDRYLWGGATRISPEAPVPVLQLQHVDHRPGGAANVAANVVGMGGSAGLVGCLGSDLEAETLKDLLKNQGMIDQMLAVDEHRPTTCKTRVISDRQQVVRVDRESRVAVSAEVEDQLLTSIQMAIRYSKVIVLSDYDKGVSTKRFCRELIELARHEGKLVVVDPKGNDYSKYEGATVLVPNQHEAGAETSVEIDDDDSAVQAGRILLHRVGCDAVLITRGDRGASVIAGDDRVVHIPTSARQVFDVTGAGDTMVAALSLALGVGVPLEDAAAIANTAAGLAVEKVGTAVVRHDELIAALGYCQVNL